MVRNYYNLLDINRKPVLQHVSVKDISEHIFGKSKQLNLTRYADQGNMLDGKYYIEISGKEHNCCGWMTGKDVNEWECTVKRFRSCIWVKPGTPQARGAIKLSVAKR